MIRRIIRLRYFDRLSWDAVAIAVDGTKSGDGMRVRLDTILQSFILFNPDLQHWEKIKDLTYKQFLHQKLEMYSFINEDDLK